MTSDNADMKEDGISQIIQTYLQGLHNPSDDSLYNELRAKRDTENLKLAVTNLVKSEKNSLLDELLAADVLKEEPQYMNGKQVKLGEAVTIDVKDNMKESLVFIETNGKNNVRREFKQLLESKKR